MVEIRFEDFAFVAEKAIVKKCSVLLKNQIEGDTDAEYYAVNLPSKNAEHFCSLVQYLKSGMWSLESTEIPSDASPFPHLYVNADYLGCEEVTESLRSFVRNDDTAIDSVMDLP